MKWVSQQIHREQVKRKRKRGCRAGLSQRLKRLLRENKRGMVKITGLPESGCSEIDIAKLAQPFGTPVKILLITTPSEALVTMQDVESAQEMVKVYNNMPVCINDSVLNMSLLPNLQVDFNRPVALFHSLMGPRNPVSAEVGGDDDWNRLLVVSNIPATPSGPTEIQKLVQRFGTVQQTLALKDKIIFEMETAEMAQSVFNRFQKFPCIVQNNKLAFSWKPDPETDLPKVNISAGSTAPTGGKVSQTEETTTPPGGQEDSLSQSGLKVAKGTGVDTNVKGQEVQPGDEGMKVEGEVEATEKESPALGGKEQEEEPDASSLQPAGMNQREDTEPNTDQPGGQGGEEVMEKVANISTTESEETEEPVASDATAAPQAAKPETATSAPAPNVMAAIIEALRQESRNRSSTKVTTDQAAAENPPGKQPTDKETPDVQAAPALPRVTPEILKVLLEECRVRSSSRANAEQARKEQDQAPPADQKAGGEQVTKRKTREEEREERERARREREKRLKAQEEEREQGRRDRKLKAQEEEREKGRREREKRRSHREGSSGSPGSRSSMRYEGSRRSGRSGAKSESRRGNGEDKHPHVVKSSKQQEEEELGEKHVPFDMEDFVTVDEVGEVAAVPHPSPETTTEMTEVTELTGNDPVTTPASEAEQQAPADTTPMEVEGEPGTAKVQGEALDKRGQKEEEGLAPATTEEGSVKTAEGTGEVTEEKVPDFQDDIKEPVVTVPKTTCDKFTEESEVKGHDEATPTDAPAAAGEEEVEEEKEDGGVEDFNTGTFLTVDEVGQVEEDGKKRSAETVESKRRRTSQEEREEEAARRKMKMEPLFSKDYSIPPFNPDSPVGMEFLVPKSGFFCKVCSKFYSGTDEAKKTHCRSLKHHQNLEKSLEKWRAKKD